MAPSHRQAVEAILADAAAERSRLLEQLSPALRASLPVDAAGITQALEHLANAVGLGDELRREQALAHRANPAVLHGRVFGRTPLSPGTVLASFVEGARVRAGALLRLAVAIGGAEVEREVAALLERHPPDPGAEDPEPALRATYAAHEAAAVLLARRLDGDGPADGAS